MQKKLRSFNSSIKFPQFLDYFLRIFAEHISLTFTDRAVGRRTVKWAGRGQREGVAGANSRGGAGAVPCPLGLKFFFAIFPPFWRKSLANLCMYPPPGKILYPPLWGRILYIEGHWLL